MLCHQSRLEGSAADRPETCWLEVWSRQAQNEGRRALDQLRDGVQLALESLGTGFIAHPANQDLRQRLQAGELRKEEFYRQLLRLVYRLIFLFVAEDRNLLHGPGATEEARSRYARFYSGQHLRRLAERSRGGRHSDLWVGLRLVFAKLGDDHGCPELGLPALGGFLFDAQALADLDAAELGNDHFLQAIRHLGLVKDNSGWRLVDYRNLGSEELGSIYESLLELSPTMELEAGVFTLQVVGGNERRTTGSYYTPESLIQCLLESALDPVLAEAGDKPDPEQAIMALKVCEPACGSGHFLIAAAHRIARKLASVRTGEEAPSPESIRHALRDVIGRCLYGVDLNPMAVELCKVNLWLEALEPGKPLSFLDAHIQCGNSLLGTTPALMAQGIPDEAFSPLEGDERTVVTALKRRNRDERRTHARRGKGHDSHTELFSTLGRSRGGTLAALHSGMTELEGTGDSDIQGIHAKEARFRALRDSAEWAEAKLQADAWCAAFVWEKTTQTAGDVGGAAPLTQGGFEQLLLSPDRLPARAVERIRSLAETYAFHHWHLAFPQVFQPGNGSLGWVGGFDVVLGNPPWETLEMKEEEWFAARDEHVASAPTAAERTRRIAALAENNPGLLAAFKTDLRIAQGTRQLIRESGQFPLCAVGKINTYSIFAETMRNLLLPRGQAGIVVPSGIATDDTTKFFFQDLMQSGALQRLYDFENREKIFPAVDSRIKFSLVTMGGAECRASQGTDFAFFLLQVEDLEDPDKHFTLTAEDLALLSPNTGTCATFRSKTDAELTKAIYRRVPVLIQEADEEADPPMPEVNPWRLSFSQGLFNMASDSGLFKTRGDLSSDGWTLDGNSFRKDQDAYLPLYEAKMLHHFDHRFATYANDTDTRDFEASEKADHSTQVMPRYWVPEREVKLRAADIPKGLRRALTAGDSNAMANALGEWALGADLVEASVGEGPQLAVAAQDLWRTRRAQTPCLDHVNLSNLALDRALEAATTCGWTPQDEAVLSVVQPPERVAETFLEHRTPRWFMGWRDITNATNERTVIASALPRAGVGHTSPLFRSRLGATLRLCFQANLTAFVLDYLARQKIGGTHLTYGYLFQLAVLPPDAYATPCAWSPGESLEKWISTRALELAYTARDMQALGCECGSTGPAFCWNEERRFLLRCELDAAFFHLYGISREDVAYVMGTFPIVKRKDEAAYGTFQTKETILFAYDAMAEAIKRQR
ncbi:Eco57I restriction-modification methylase domain-containing protein [Holophaga foetida]|uniref:Eco57I restriction-modification methylase domain-containing protein n=1 Tax=Holophaga foetida TaxID=35839 RepID=UPI00024725C5|nr:N-6 DNA methylase [Holophaga foetida]